MRVLINAVHSKSGGGVTYLRNMLPLLRAEGLDLHVVVQADQEDMAREVCGTLPLHILPLRSKLVTVLLQEQIALPILAARLKARVVFSPANYGPLLGVRSVLLLRNAFEVDSLEKRWSKRAYWRAVRLLTWACFKTCRRAIIVSAHACRAFLDGFGLADDPRISVVHHGVGTAFHPPADDGVRVRHRLLAVSDLYVQKNFETLLRAVARLKPDFPDLSLHIAGRALDPAYAQGLRDLCHDLKLDGAVTFLGGQPPARVAALYREAQVFVFPSLVETFGNPLVEAMASGIPIVCTKAAAMPEILGDAGILVQPRDVDSMADAIARLLGDPALWRVTADKGLDRAKAFSWKKNARLTAAILREAGEA
ncbi:Glycosyltransferase [Candidatus Terasakiella magnetica]|nr:Glycosyltransferase [Candidatus Terasakiella magnetica]